MLKSLNGDIDHDSTVTLVAVLSIAGGLGRIFAATSDFVPLRRGWFLMLASFAMMIAHLLNAYVVVDTTGLLLTTALIGFTYGIIWAIMPVSVGDSFGRDHFGEYWGWLNIAPGLSSVVFNQTTGALYQLQVPEQQVDCTGKDCYHNAYLLSASASALGCIAALFLISAS